MEIWRILNGFMAFKWKYEGIIASFKAFNENMKDFMYFNGYMEEL
jgi:hypothetical protein